MANPRRTTLQLHHGDSPNPSSILPLSSSASSSPSQSSLTSSLLSFLKRPHAFPILLSIFVLLTWLALRFQHHPHPLPSPLSSSPSLALTRQLGVADPASNSIRFSALDFPSRIARDRRGWLLDPISAARDAGIQGGAQSCVSVHVGEIRPGAVRGNHRHHTCNETLVLWGAVTKFRLENAKIANKAYAEVTVAGDEVAIIASPSGTAHALINIDRERATFFLGCQDNVIDYASSTDFNIWKDI